jgi:hypothetical protein
MAKKSSKKSARRALGRPLEPGILEELGVLSVPPKLGSGFDPNGNWRHAYRIYGNHGYYKSGNGFFGSLKITRSALEDGKLDLKVAQQTEHTDNAEHRLDANVQCRADEATTLVSWKLVSRFFARGKERAELGLTEEVTVNDGSLRVRCNGRDVVRPGGKRLTSDWCLFDAVQRRPFDAEAFVSFDLLDGLTLRKPAQRLTYRGAEAFSVKGTKRKLHRFSSLGPGDLPFDFWLDEEHRLILVTSLCRAYILDEAKP